eukprot:TRINITY_DN2643_c0_g1_i2.p1 TRINITY_DN2643_c0_g1~~TRINITY_DN2643_c0_g1_i2.p1  ORF type:complete len:428 (+),score=88.25 TRINITY_DN2643_c0_g1_i2:93-1376(+)
MCIRDRVSTQSTGTPVWQEMEEAHDEADWENDPEPNDLDQFMANYEMLMSSSYQPPQTNHEMVDALTRSAGLTSVRSEEILEAFRQVDRGIFTPQSASPRSKYNDNSPLREGTLHLSATSIYAKVLEGLELSKGLSFLNIGSGSGYLSALVAQIIGERALNTGIEYHASNVQHARENCAGLGLDRINFIQGDCFEIDTEKSIRYDRVYIGAGANDTAKFLFKLCKPGGIIVGPFGVDGGWECLKKARYTGDRKFAVSDLLSVTFAPLICQDPTPKKLVLTAKTWSPMSHAYFPLRFQKGVRFILLCIKHNTPLAVLPQEVWFSILSMLHHDWMADPIANSALCVVCSVSSGLSWCSRCKLVRYCSKSCQRSDWKRHKEHGCVPVPNVLPSNTLSPSTTPVLQPTTPMFHYSSPQQAQFMPDFELEDE